MLIQIRSAVLVGDPQQLPPTVPVTTTAIVTATVTATVTGTQVQSVILVGDPQQLPPTVKAVDALKLGLGVTLFERLQYMGLRPLLLDTQYR